MFGFRKRQHCIPETSTLNDPHNDLRSLSQKQLRSLFLENKLKAMDIFNLAKAENRCLTIIEASQVNSAHTLMDEIKKLLIPEEIATAEHLIILGI